jgi:ATP-dependent 26S proteasome regulatory subunit
MNQYQSRARYFADRCELAMLMVEAANGNEDAAVAANRKHAFIHHALDGTSSGLPPVALLRHRLRLSDTEENVFWMLVCVELDDTLRAQISKVFPLGVTCQALMQMAYRDQEADAMHELSDQGRLVQLDLIAGDSVTPGASLLRRNLYATQRALALALGSQVMSHDVSMFVESMDQNLKSTLQTVDVTWDPNVFTVVADPLHAGAREALVSNTAARDERAIEINALNIDPCSATGQRQLRCIARDASLLGFTPVFFNFDAWAGDNEGVKPPTEALRCFDQHFLQWATGPVFATCSKAAPTGLRYRRVINIAMEAPTSAVFTETWATAIAAVKENPSLAESAAQRFQLPIAEIGPTVASSQFLAGDRALALSDIHAVIRTRMDDQLRRFGKRVSVSQTWSDLVLPNQENLQIAELFARIEYKDTVYQKWGFAAKVGKGNGLAALLSGPPGTGKTMVAGLIAKDLNLDLYQIDTSKIISKFIGETEKNLAAVFDLAESGHAILLFDEADSLFGKRTEVKSSNDRNANVETNFLLQRLESFSGFCILTTNHEDAIDSAFKRRLAMHVRLPVPDETERAQLWERMIPVEAPVGNDFDPAALARSYVMTGGYIKNAVVRAAFFAAVNARPMLQRDFALAAGLECQAMGRVVLG